MATETDLTITSVVSTPSAWATDALAVEIPPTMADRGSAVRTEAEYRQTC